MTAGNGLLFSQAVFKVYERPLLGEGVCRQSNSSCLDRELKFLCDR